MLYIGILVYLILNTLGFYKTFRRFVDKEILEGIKWSFLTVATTLGLVFLLRQISWDSFWLLQILTSTYITGKALNIAITYTINIYLLDKKKKNKNKKSKLLSTPQSIGAAVLIFAIVFTYFAITKDYTKINPMTLAFVEAISYPLLGASIIQKLQFKLLEKENE